MCWDVLVRRSVLAYRPKMMNARYMLVTDVTGWNPSGLYVPRCDLARVVAA